MIGRASSAAITAATGLLVYSALRRAYPRQCALIESEVERMWHELRRISRYSDAPGWWRELADTRGLKPGDDSEPLANG